jgi:hypothetical protein
MKLFCILAMAASLGTGHANQELNTSDRNILNTQIQNNLESISVFFSDNAYVFYETDKVYKGKKEIKDLYAKLFKGKTLEEVETKHTEAAIEAGLDYFYEIGHYIFADKTFSYLCKWDKHGENWKKEFEVLSEKQISSEDVNGVIIVKKKTIEVSKNRDNAKTVASLYLKDGYYYSKGQLHAGRAAISNTWSPGTVFTDLQSKAYAQPKVDLIYEIGQYSVPGYTGLYVLVWKKENGDWQVYLDSNV